MNCQKKVGQDLILVMALRHMHDPSFMAQAHIILEKNNLKAKNLTKVYAAMPTPEKQDIPV